MNYLVGYAVRYIMRFKNGEEDLDKAIHTIEKMKSVFYPKSKDKCGGDGPYAPLLTALPYPLPGALEEAEKWAHQHAEDTMRTEWANTRPPLSEQEAADEVRARATAYANAKPDADVPRGYILEEVSSPPGCWHWRKVGGTWGVTYESRASALRALLEHRLVFNTK
jgi:hypothetical protein